MPDFSEHIPDRVFAAILANLGRQLPDSLLYVYTPNRSHIFEILKHRNLILKNPEGHINVKSRGELERFLRAHGWEIVSSEWRGSSIPVWRQLESALGHVPLLGRLFQRRIALVARVARGTPA